MLLPDLRVPVSLGFNFFKSLIVVMKWSIVSAVSLLVAAVAAEHPFLRRGRLVPPVEAEDEFPISINAAAKTTGSAFFTQLLDHNNPSKGTFQQKFWWNSEHWAGPGSPVRTYTIYRHCPSLTDYRLSSSLLVKLLLQIMVPT